MARRNRKKNKTSWAGALVIEALAVVAFVALFVQARAERQQEVAGEAPTSAVAAWPSMLEQTPFQNVLGQTDISAHSNYQTEKNVVFSAETFFSRFANID